MQYNDRDNKPRCRECGEEYPTARWAIGYKWCLSCGDKVAQQTRHTIAPMHKSNYVLITNTDILRQLNKYAK